MRAPALWLGAVLAAASVAVAALGWSALLEYRRGDVLRGAGWLLLTGQFCHYGAGHLAGNAAAALGIGWMFRALPGREALTVAGGAVLAVAVGLVLEPSPLGSYRGLSGLLYGWLAGAAVLRAGRWLLVPVALVGLAALELALGVTRAVAPGVPVHAAVHLYGIAGGVAAAWVWVRRRRSVMLRAPTP